MAITEQQAQSGHCTTGGTIKSGSAICECGAWKASDSAPAERSESRKAHLAEVLRARLGRSA